ncbi:helix-turn-helix domain-containing protein [Pediococcus pentosaceus]|uniref:helix-turn-helix domain-containing protein n=1 Tax=Pediococcus pentosaceus TaxID=1255 RepID=UPI0018FE4D1C|nr:helix-turn-helix transcriptional regulator [Pediococcus pentosaceus]MBF7122495.1 helix-turn-helix domain-containing protein [Pediococcus pentosaceus]MBF7131616.1 helix-turn-helix domain-containing protein [Pediococcus pentosaceus]MCS8563906.1 XRE family transcriptional regulator [Pediococcus pentosaceus]MCS8568201.1 XRE family transcriptional regulator [Pediococcus pentosaceus]MCS8580843.1 XRE family transcriptional regulator [Pediococcus pentosaceus]
MKNNFSTILGSKLLKIQDVVNATGISRTTLTNIYYMESKNIQLKTLIEICDFLDVSLSELIEYRPQSAVNS